MQKKNIIVLIISLSVILLLGSSYAVLKVTKESQNPYTLSIGTLNVEFEDGLTENLNIDNMYPMTDEEGMNQEKELSFSIINNGNIKSSYNIYIEETTKDIEFKNHINFTINKNSTGYNDIKNLKNDKYIDKYAELDSGKNVTYKIKLWLDENAENEYMNKIFKAKLVIDVRQFDITLYTKIHNAIEKKQNTIIADDGVEYLSGTNEDVNYNYVWYSGKLWRITSINADGTIKMVTENPITVIRYGESIDFETSYIKEWLNNDFLDTLYNYNDIIENYNWNITPTTDYTTKLENTNMSRNYVGLLNTYDYYMCQKNTTPENSYIKNGFYSSLMNSDGISKIWRIATDGTVIPESLQGYPYRPSIVLKANVSIKDGDGTKTNPYTLYGDKEITENQKLNTRLSGEYVNFDNKVYRIMYVENGKTKLIMNDYFKDESQNILKKAFSDGSASYADSVSNAGDYWGYYLNNTWYNSINENYKKMIVKGTYYLGKYNTNYKTTICKDSSLDLLTKECEKIDDIWEGYVGLPRIGELFAVLQPSKFSTVYTLTPNFNKTSLDTFYLSGSRDNNSLPTELLAVKPTIFLSSNVTITSGEGTEKEPYEIVLAE